MIVQNKVGLLKVFVSSTFRDLKDEREQILKQLDTSLFPVGMEFFIPDGKTSQQIALLNEEQGIKHSDLVIFLISPRYGSIIKDCLIKEHCNADCPMKTGSNNRISYTHCEYKFAKSENKPIQVYLYDKNGWQVIQALQEMETLDWKLIRSNPIFNDYSNTLIEELFSVKSLSCAFKEEIQSEFVPVIDSNQLFLITQNLADRIIQLYNDGKISFKDFCGRRCELKELISKLDESVEVYGVGGIGKTSLIQIVLLLQKLKGKKIVSIGKKQSYLSGSGYPYFYDKCHDDIYEITTNLITINDVVEAIKFNAVLKIEDPLEKIQVLKQNIENDNIIIFIDDFHLADSNVKKLISSSKNFIIASKTNTGITKKQLHLIGISEDDRESLIDIISQHFSKKISLEAKKKIHKISEGHPITIELLVRNFEKINFETIEDLKRDALIVSNQQQVDEFISRVIKGILTTDAFQLVKGAAIINTEIENNIDKNSLLKSFSYPNKILLFNELIDTGLIKKKEKQENAYQFSFKHLQETIRESDLGSHHIAINYYKNKFTWVKKTVDDEVELLYHNIHHDPQSDFSNIFFRISPVINPVNYNFKRLIEIGEYIKKRTTLEHQYGISNNLGIMYGTLHRYKEAKDTYNSAIEIIDSLYSNKKIEYLNAKRAILLNLGTLYSDINKKSNAETCYLQSLEIGEELLRRQPTIENKVEFGKVLLNLGNVQKNLEKYDDAEKTYQRNLTLQSEIARKRKILYSEDIASCLNNLAGLYLSLCNFNEAECKSKESISIVSNLVKRNPSKYEPIYYTYIANLGRIHLALENFSDAETELLEAHDKLKGFFRIIPDVYCPDLVETLNALVTLNLKLRRYKMARTYAMEAERLNEFLVKQCSYAYLSYQANTFRNLAMIYSHLYKPKEANEYIAKSQLILESLSHKKLNYYLMDTVVLNNIKGDVLLKLHRYDDAAIEWNKSFETIKELTKINEDAYLPFLAVSLNNLGHLFSLTKKYDLAKDFLRECLVIRRKLILQCSDAHLGDLTHTLNSLGCLYTEISENNEPEQYFQEALDICELLISAKKEQYKIELAETLHNFANYYIENRKYAEAREKINDALNIRTALVENDPDANLPDLIDTIQKICKLNIEEGKNDEAEKFGLIALHHLNILVSKNPDIYNPAYASSLNLLGEVYVRKNLYTDAEKAFRKALLIRRIYFEREKSMFAEDLMETLCSLLDLYYLMKKDSMQIQSIINEISDMDDKVGL